MGDMSIVTKLFLSLVLGAAVGLERESYEDSLTEDGQGKPGGLGVRSFSLVTLLATVAGLLYDSHFILFLVVTCTFMVMVISYYITGSLMLKDNGMTTELAIIFSFLLGLFIGFDFLSLQLIIALTVILILIMSRKKNIKHFVTTIRRHELNGLVSYAIIALVVLPFLPNQAYSLADAPGLIRVLTTYGFDVSRLINVEVINPYKIWLVVAIVTGVDVLGYLLKRLVGNRRGWGIASMVGGFVSSTATTISLAEQSKKTDVPNMLVAAAILANVASFAELFVLLSVFNNNLLLEGTPFIVTIFVVGALLGLYFMYRSRKQDSVIPEESMNDDQIFSITPAVSFAGIFLVVQIASQFGLVIFGANGLYTTSALAALTGVAAPVINIAQLAEVTVTLSTALWTLFIINAVNLAAKIVYSFVEGSKSFAITFSSSMAVIIVASLVAILLG